jgi:prepilin peptidase CpaA
MSHSFAALGVATVLLLGAAACDLLGRRIPNALNALLLGSGLWAQGSRGGAAAALAAFGTCLLVVALLWPLWSRGRMGGGDVKMAGAAAAWMGWGLLPPFLLATALAGGVVAIACAALSSRQARRQMRANLTAVVAGQGAPPLPIRGGPGRVSVPYGVAVALGALVVVWASRLS